MKTGREERGNAMINIGKICVSTSIEQRRWQLSSFQRRPKDPQIYNFNSQCKYSKSSSVLISRESSALRIFNLALLAHTNPLLSICMLFAISTIPPQQQQRRNLSRSTWAQNRFIYFPILTLSCMLSGRWCGWKGWDPLQCLLSCCIHFLHARCTSKKIDR